MKKIIVIGLRETDDLVTLEKIAAYFYDNGRRDLAERIWSTPPDYDVYDMTTMPERGDAFDAIDRDTALVIALHLYGIDKVPVKDAVLKRAGAPIPSGDLFSGKNGRNGLILQRCMKLGIPLVAWGDQPWNGVEKKTEIHPNSLYLYEKEATAGETGSRVRRHPSLATRKKVGRPSRTASRS